MGATVPLLDATGARAALAVALPMAVLLYLWPRAVTRVAAALSVVAVLTAPLTLPSLADRPSLFAIVDNFKESAGHRLLIWRFTGARIAERPWLGWGLDAARAVPGGDVEARPGEKFLPLHPHNAALQTWLELGVPGAMLFALFLGWLWLRLGQMPWPRPYRRGSRRQPDRGVGRRRRRLGHLAGMVARDPRPGAVRDPGDGARRGCQPRPMTALAGDASPPARLARASRFV